MFLDLAESGGVAAALDFAVARRAMDQLLAWGEHAPARMSVNCANATLSEPGAVEMYAAICEQVGLDRLCLEVVERHALTDVSIGALAELRRRGVRVSLDDVGTGYASAWVLDEVAIDELKIARRFTAALQRSRAARSIVRAVVSMANDIGADTVAEGVEDLETAADLAAMGVTLLQGHTWSPPVRGATLRFPSRNGIGGFVPAPIPPSEPDRLAALHAYRALDSAPEPALERLVQIAADVCRTPIALVSLIDTDRQWFQAKTGLDAAETPRDVSFCGHAVNAWETGALPTDGPAGVFMVQDARCDPTFADNPLSTGAPEVVLYAGAPLISRSGHAVGTLCVIDHTPRNLSDEQLALLRALADQVVAHLELRAVSSDLAVALSQRAAAEDALRHEATHDSLTSLANRRLFFERIAELIEHNEDFGLVFVDLDGFKLINDTSGHLAGDAHLVWCALALKSAVGRTGLVARYGGDEFAVLVRGGEAEVSSVAAALHGRFDRRLDSPSGPIEVGASIGHACWEIGQDISEVVAAADERMYATKQRQRTSAHRQRRAFPVVRLQEC